MENWMTVAWRQGAENAMRKARIHMWAGFLSLRQVAADVSAAV
ncbi:MAG: hypothetical protein WCS52_03475 [bacterium]